MPHLTLLQFLADVLEQLKWICPRRNFQPSTGSVKLTLAQWGSGVAQFEREWWELQNNQARSEKIAQSTPEAFCERVQLREFGKAWEDKLNKYIEIC